MRLIDADAFDERVRAAGGMSEEELSEDFKDGVLAVLYMMSKQPTITAQPEQRWIPSNEKPPEKGSYLVWMPFAPSKHRMTVAEYCGGYWNIKTPISAWMPLPEPYKEGTDD